VCQVLGVLVLIVVLLVVGPDLGAYVQAFGRCGCPGGSVLLVVLVWVCPGGGGGAGDGVTVKRGGMYERIRKVKGHTFTESFVP
jgi:hypothetical protein